MQTPRLRRDGVVGNERRGDQRPSSAYVQDMVRTANASRTDASPHSSRLPRCRQKLRCAWKPSSAADEDDALARDVEHAISAERCQAARRGRRKTTGPKRSLLARAHRSRRSQYASRGRDGSRAIFSEGFIARFTKKPNKLMVRADSVKRYRTLLPSTRLATRCGLRFAAPSERFRIGESVMQTFVRPNVDGGAKTLPASWYISPEVFAQERERIFARAVALRRARRIDLAAG